MVSEGATNEPELHDFLAIELMSDLESFRQQYRKEEVPAQYSGVRHFLLTHCFALGTASLALLQLDQVLTREWWAIPLTFLYANLAEYLGHRFVMHVPRRGLRAIWKRHVGQHHRFFPQSDMFISSTRDFKVVLFPPILIALFIGGFGVPVAWLIAQLVSANVAWLFVLTGVLYFLSYEYLHLAWHLPATHWCYRLPFMTVLRRLHTAHHDVRWMGKVNFNITWPVGDLLFRTLRLPPPVPPRE
jgi:Fatty acid hydroxylase superfamily